MALHYILDGYNVIKKTAFLNHKKLKDARQALLDFIYKYRPHGSVNNRITIVFDGKEGIGNFNKENHDLCVIFSKGESADGLIKSQVEQAPNPKNIIIVSEDKDIILYCRPLGAKILSVEDFIKKGYSKLSASKSNKYDGESMELSFLERKKINEELTKIWLK